MAELRVEIETHRMLQTNDFEVHVRDGASGETLVRFRLDPVHAWKFVVGGGVMEVDARVSPNLHRLGREMEVLTAGFAEVNAVVMTREQRAERALKAAKTQYPDWEEYLPRHRNDGTVEIVMRRWPEASPAREG